MNIEQTINYQLNKFPVIKKIIKRLYQIVMYGLSKKIKSEGEIMNIFLVIMINLLGIFQIDIFYV